MVPTQDLTLSWLDLAANDPLTLAALAPGNKVHLSKSAFTANKSLLLSSLIEATFPGYVALVPTPGDQEVGYDSLVGQWFVQLKAPAGGWYWEASADPSAAETVYGAYLTDNAGTALYGSETLPQPVSIQAAGHSVVFPALRFYLGQ